MRVKHFFYPTGIYLLGLLVGFNISPSPILDIFREKLPLVDYSNQSDYMNFLLIVENNIRVVVINIIGSFSFGVISVLNTFYNGFILGYSISTSLNYFPVREVMRRFLPHSLEILTVVYSCGTGLVFGNYFMKRYLFDKRAVMMNMRAFGVHLMTVIVITILSAYLEAYVSMKP